MNKTKFAFLFSLLMFSLSSCTKEVTSLTQGQLTAQKLESELGLAANTVFTNYLVDVTDLNSGASLISNGNSFELTSDGFIIVTTGSGANVTTTYFNLGQLKAYQIFTGANLINYTPNIQLYF